ncbi:MAG: DNA polymerase III subunit delta, partial [Bacteroidota bacterium]
MTFQNLIQQIDSGNFAPLYYLHGVEGYFIDKVVAKLEEKVLSPSEAAFNKEVYYGSETQLAKVLNACQSFPVMANRRLILVKEAQQVSKKEWDRLSSYLKAPIPTSTLVIAFKGKNAGLPKAIAAGKHPSVVEYHAKKLYENDIQKWVSTLLQEKGVESEPGIPAILTSNLGTNISLIDNELDKMLIYLKATNQQVLRKDFVFEMINVDKEFNVFELIQALSIKNRYRAHMIIDRLTQNTKINPPVLTLSALFRFFDNLALVHSHKLRDPNSIKHQLKVNYYAARDYSAAKEKYSLGQTYRNIRLIQEADQAL